LLNSIVASSNTYCFRYFGGGPLKLTIAISTKTVALFDKIAEGVKVIVSVGVGAASYLRTPVQRLPSNGGHVGATNNDNSDDDSLIDDEQNTQVGANDNLSKAEAMFSDGIFTRMIYHYRAITSVPATRRWVAETSNGDI
jgi:hypothetical protein